MDFDRDWHTFSLDAEVDAYGTSRIAGAHNRLREENARLKADLKRLEGLLLSVARVIRGRDGLPCWCDDYDARPDHTHSAKCIEARRIRAQREEPYRSVSIEAQREEGR